jgi:hypothetical protein
VAEIHAIWTRATFAFVLPVAGFVSAAALAGCGGSGSSSVGQASTQEGSVAASRPAVTRTRTEETDTQTRPAATDTGSQPVATVTQTRPAVTVSQATTVVAVTPPAQTTPQTTAEVATNEADSTPAWVWVLVAVGAGLAIALVVWLLRRRSTDRSTAERQRVLAGAVASWTAQGWAIESETEISAVLRRNGERLAVSVDADGRVSSRPLGTPSESVGPT